jgi:hypothetical protein
MSPIMPLACGFRCPANVFYRRLPMVTSAVTSTSAHAAGDAGLGTRAPGYAGRTRPLHLRPARTHPRNGLRTRAKSIEPRTPARDDPFTGGAQGDFRGSTAPPLRDEPTNNPPPAERTSSPHTLSPVTSPMPSMRARPHWAITFIHSHANQVSDINRDINRSAQPCPPAHRVTTPMRTGVGCSTK